VKLKRCVRDSVIDAGGYPLHWPESTDGRKPLRGKRDVLEQKRYCAPPGFRVESSESSWV
jgi:hypothetical protein